MPSLGSLLRSKGTGGLRAPLEADMAHAGSRYTQRTHSSRNLTCGSVICALWTASDACSCASPLWGDPCRGGLCPYLWKSQLQQACHLLGPDPVLQACPHPAKSHTCSARSQPHETIASPG